MGYKPSWDTSATIQNCLDEAPPSRLADAQNRAIGAGNLAPIMLVPLTERCPVAPGQGWLKGAGSVPAALLDGDGSMGLVR